jgi:hypothetical protein
LSGGRAAGEDAQYRGGASAPQAGRRHCAVTGRPPRFTLSAIFPTRAIGMDATVAAPAHESSADRKLYSGIRRC